MFYEPATELLPLFVFAMVVDGGSETWTSVFYFDGILA
jgi:hypothetical protein